MTVRFDGTDFVLKRGDITREMADVIVNAANSTLLGGGGVDGAIHRAGGPRILEECKAIRARQRDCPTGEAVITTAGDLPARWVVHTVGPVWTGGSSGEDELLARAYRSSLTLAGQHGAKTVAFPAISTGVYGFPIRRAAPIALETSRAFVMERDGIDEIRFILFSQSDFDVYKEALERMPVTQPSRS